MKNLIIPNSIENYPVKEIGSNCFSNINKVESITVFDSVVAIGDFAFFGCPNLTKVVIPSSVKNWCCHKFRLTFHDIRRVRFLCRGVYAPSRKAHLHRPYCF